MSVLLHGDIDGVAEGMVKDLQSAIAKAQEAINKLTELTEVVNAAASTAEAAKTSATSAKSTATAANNTAKKAQAFPSTKKTAITWDGSAITYTAPANGYVYAWGRALSAACCVSIRVDNGLGSIMYQPNKSSDTFCWLPVAKGTTVRISSNDANNPVAYFYYAEGEA